MKFLRNILDSQKPLFQKGGKFEKFHYLFEAGEVERLRMLVNKIIKNELPELGKQARKEIENNWSAQKEAKELAELYIKLFD